MSSNLPLVRQSRRVLPWSGGGLKRAKWKGGLINEGGVISSEYGNSSSTGGQKFVNRLNPWVLPKE